MGVCSKGRVEIPITNVNAEIKQKLKAIAKYEGTTVSDLLRPQLRIVCEKYPDNIINEFIKKES